MNWAEIYRRLRRDRDDARAYAGLWDRVRGWAKRDVWQHGWHVVDDAAADTCSAVVVGLERARGAETFAGFVLGHYFNVRRRILAGRALATVPLEEADAVTPGEPPIDPYERDLLRRCLAELLPRDRRAVELYFLRGASHAEIARELAVAEGNARRIVFNGKAGLRRCVRRAWPEGRG